MVVDAQGSQVGGLVRRAKHGIPRGGVNEPLVAVPVPTDGTSMLQNIAQLVGHLEEVCTAVAVPPKTSCTVTAANLLPKKPMSAYLDKRHLTARK